MTFDEWLDAFDPSMLDAIQREAAVLKLLKVLQGIGSKAPLPRRLHHGLACEKCSEDPCPHCEFQLDAGDSECNDCDGTRVRIVLHEECGCPTREDLIGELPVF